MYEYLKIRDCVIKAALFLIVSLSLLSHKHD